MALEWWDGFDQYGSQAWNVPHTLLLDGVYADVEFGFQGGVLSANPRTGTRHLRIAPRTNDPGVRRVLTAPRASFGLAFAMSLTNLPSNYIDFGVMQAYNSAGNTVFTVMVGPSGDLIIRNGGRQGAPLATYVNPAVFANSYQHFECKFDNGFKVWMNEVLLIDSPNMPSGIPGGNVITSVRVGMYGLALINAPEFFDVDDLFCYNTEGPDNTGPIGDCKAFGRFVDEDLTPQDFDASIGTSRFAMLDNVPPLDGTEYISASGAGTLPKRSTFGVADLPLDIVEVKGVMLSTRMFKLDAGSAVIQTGVISGASETLSAPHAISMAPIFYSDVFERNPATDAAWDLASVNSLNVFLQRTS